MQCNAVQWGEQYFVGRPHLCGWMKNIHENKCNMESSGGNMILLIFKIFMLKNSSDFFKFNIT